mgnify:CR=1 FL=1
MLVYSITAEALRFLGLSHISELPEYEEVTKQLDVSEATDEPEE